MKGLISYSKLLTSGVAAPDAILVSGGRDGLLKTWDSELHEIGEGCDISVDADGDGVNDIG